LTLSSYWKKRGQKFSSELENQPNYIKSYMQTQEKLVLTKLKSGNWNKILEIGCGNGRLTKSLLKIPNVKKIVAIDISKDLIKYAMNKIQDDRVVFQTIDLNEFETDEKFDLVFGSEILMHIPENQIKDIISKLLNLCKKKLYFIEYYDLKQINNNTSDYCFMHDYKNLFESYENIKVKIHMISQPLTMKLINKYAKMRGRNITGTQALIELTLVTS